MGKIKATLHQNLFILQVADPLLLDTLLADATLASHIVTRLSDRVAIISPRHEDVVLARLFKLRHTPKVLEE